MTMTTNMKETLKRLTRLQEIDARIYALKIRRAEIPRQIEEQVRALARARERQAAAENRSLELRKSIDARNLELRDLEGKKYHKEVQLNTISTNDAYKAMLKDIAGIQADCSRIEDAILELSYTLDEVATHIAEARKDVAAAGKEHDQRQIELREQAEALDQEIGDLDARRKGQVKSVNSDVLRQYDRILEHRGGQALAVVRDQHCHGCQMHLTLHEMTILMACRELLTCRTCSRILYLEVVIDPVEI